MSDYFTKLQIQLSIMKDIKQVLINVNWKFNFILTHFYLFLKCTTVGELNSNIRPDCFFFNTLSKNQSISCVSIAVGVFIKVIFPHFLSI